MINYKGLPQRVRRIVKQYEYCIESVEWLYTGFSIKLKEGYKFEDGTGSLFYVLTESTDLIYFLKKVTKPATRVIRTALYGFPCPICGRQTSKGSNYTDLGGMKICGLCG